MTILSWFVRFFYLKTTHLDQNKAKFANYKKVNKEEKKESRCDIEIKVDWQELSPIKKDRNAPFIIASFDIECFSTLLDSLSNKKPPDDDYVFYWHLLKAKPTNVWANDHPLAKAFCQ